MDSLRSLRSEGSILSIGSRGSILSVGSTGSTVGRFRRFRRVDSLPRSAGSIGSALSAGSLWSVGSEGARFRCFNEPAQRRELIAWAACRRRPAG